MSKFFVRYDNYPPQSREGMMDWGTMVEAESAADAVYAVIGDSMYEYVRGEFKVWRVDAIELGRFELEVRPKFKQEDQ